MGLPFRCWLTVLSGRCGGELIEDRERTVDLFHRCAVSYGGVKRAQRMMGGLQFRDDRIPSAEEFREAIEVNKLAAIRFTPA